MTAAQLSALAALLQRKYREAGAGQRNYSIHDWYLEIRPPLGEEVLKRLMAAENITNARGPSLDTIQNLVAMYGREATDALGITPTF